MQKYIKWITGFILTVICGAYAADVSAKTSINIALSKWGATATASSEYGAGYEASNVLDGQWFSRETDKWNSAAGNGSHWLQIDFGSERVIDRIVVRHEGVYGEGEKFNTADFCIQEGPSSQGPWVDLVSPVKSNTDNVTTHSFSPTKTRYIRVFIEKGDQGSNQFGRIYEIEVYSDMSGIDSIMFGVDFSANKFRTVEGKLETLARIEILCAEPVPVELQINEDERVNLGILKSGQPKDVWIPAISKPMELSLFVKGKQLPTRFVQTPMPMDWGYFADGTVHLICSSHNHTACFDTPA